MIGQKYLLKYIEELVQKGFPRFVIVTGQKGQGKTEVIKYISRSLDIPFCDVGIKIDDIREMIEMSYKLTEPIIYVISNADKMSIGAKNSLLKVIEEPPQQAYFIMELNQIENTLETIKSRCQELKLQHYSSDEIQEMINIIAPGIDYETTRILKPIATNFYEIKTLMSYNPIEFYNYCVKVYENIHRVQSANSFKIPEKLDIKGTGEGYDLDLFFKMYVYLCLQDMINSNDSDKDKILYDCSEITIKCKNKLSITGINKQFLLDIWILDIRKAWLT